MSPLKKQRRRYIKLKCTLKMQVCNSSCCDTHRSNTIPPTLLALSSHLIKLTTIRNEWLSTFVHCYYFRCLRMCGPRCRRALCGLGHVEQLHWQGSILSTVLRRCNILQHASNSSTARSTGPGPVDRAPLSPIEWRHSICSEAQTVPAWIVREASANKMPRAQEALLALWRHPVVGTTTWTLAHKTDPGLAQNFVFW